MSQLFPCSSRQQEGGILTVYCPKLAEKLLGEEKGKTENCLFYLEAIKHVSK
jgi:hypothetical protein